MRQVDLLFRSWLDAGAIWCSLPDRHFLFFHPFFFAFLTCLCIHPIPRRSRIVLALFHDSFDSHLGPRSSSLQAIRPHSALFLFFSIICYPVLVRSIHGVYSRTPTSQSSLSAVSIWTSYWNSRGSSPGFCCFRLVSNCLPDLPGLTSVYC